LPGSFLSNCSVQQLNHFPQSTTVFTNTEVGDASSFALSGALEKQIFSEISSVFFLTIDQLNAQILVL